MTARPLLFTKKSGQIAILATIAGAIALVNASNARDTLGLVSGISSFLAMVIIGSIYVREYVKNMIKERDDER